MSKLKQNIIIAIAAVFAVALVIFFISFMNRPPVDDGSNALNMDEIQISLPPETSPPVSEIPLATTTTARTTAHETTVLTETEEPTVPAETTAPATTTQPETVTLAPVHVPSDDELEFLEENDIEIAETRWDEAPPLTTPPKGQHQTGETTYIDGQKFSWNPVLGWIRSSGDGNTEVMDVVSNGEKYEGGWG